ncbi:unnamed protein product [Diamesa tonsa]
MSSSEQGKPQGFSNLQENMEKQQAKITALKDLVRQSESQQGKNTASAQEKVKNIQQRLTNLKSKATKTKYKNISTFEDYGGISNIEEEPQSMDYSLPTTSANVSSTSRARSETPGSEKITLLRKQMEENRVKMAERESQKRDIEEMVTQLKSKFESSQISLEKSAELGRSMGDLSIIQPMSFSHNRSVTDVSYHTPSSFNLEGERIKYLENRIRELETTASNKTNLTESEQVQLLENKILDLEENVKEKESIIQARTKAVSLLSENLTKKKKDVVDSLEETKQEMFKMQESFLETEINYKDEVDRLNSVIQNLEECNEILEKSRYDLTIENSDLKTKLEDVQDYSAKISELNKLNENLQKRISNLESQRYDFITEEELSEAKSASLDEVNTTSNDNLSSKLEALEALIAEQKLEHETHKKETEELEEKLQEKTIELNVLNANFNVLQDKYNSLAPKSLFPKSSNDDQSQADHSKLKQQLDDSNKSAIKTKLKIKQLQKQVDAFKKTSDANGEVAKLTEENQALNQRIVELEEEKGNYQLQLVDKDNVSESELEKRIKDLEATCQNQTSAIQLLEEQKIDMTDDLNNSKKELLTIKDHSVEDVKSCEEMQQQIERLTEEKIKVQEKLNSYINENMELLDKIEKLSKGSSAESIEMVENLTQQEKLEIEQYQKSMESKKELGDDNTDAPEEDNNVEISQELNESLRNLREESSELMEKIELFTIERREVLEKLDALSIENQVLISGIENIKEEKSLLEQENNGLTENQLKIEALLVKLEAEKNELNSRVEELSELRTTQQDEINRLIQNELTSASHTVLTKTISSEPETEVVESKPTTSATVIDRESCDKLLKQLDAEIQNLNKNKDKHQKLKISKKLSTDAKNVHAMMTSLLEEYFKNLNECQQLRDDVEKIKVHVNNQNDDELIKIQKELQESVKEVDQKNQELSELQEKLVSSVKEDNNEELVSLKTTVERLNEEMSEKEELSNKLQFLVDTLTTERDHYETEVQAQRALVTDLREEFDQLCVDVKVNNQRLNEKSTELDQLQHEFDMRLKTSTNEVEILKTLVAEQKSLLIESYQEHEMDTAEKVKEINDYQNQLQKMTDDMERLKQSSVDNQQSYDNELQVEVQTLRDLLKESNELLSEHKKEIADKQETIDSLNNQIIELYKTMEENSNKLIDKEDEMQFLQEIAERNQDEIKGLNVKVMEANRAVEDLRNQLQAKHSEIVKVEHQDAGRKEAYEVRIKQAEEELKKMELKNKEQLDKLKKYAANLKMKSAKCIELEEKLAVAGSGDSSVNDEMKAQLIQYQEQLNIVKDENNKMVNTMQQAAAVVPDSSEIDALKEKISVLEHECLQLQREVTDAHEELEEEREGLQTNVKEAEERNDSLKKDLQNVTEELELMKKFHAEISAKVKEDESVQKVEDQKKVSLIRNEMNLLKQQLADMESSNRILNEDVHRKMSLEGQLESVEMRNVDIQDRNVKLMESLAIMEEEKNAIANQMALLSNEMTEKVNEFARNEYYLELQLKDLIKQDVMLEKELQVNELKCQQMVESLKELNSEKEMLTMKLKAMENEAIKLQQGSEERIHNLEAERTQLHQQVTQLQSDVKKMQTDHEKAMALKHAEIDEMEADLSSQLQRIEADKRVVQEALEKSKDQITDFQDEIIRLKDNVHSLEQSRGVMDNKIQDLIQENREKVKELEVLKDTLSRTSAEIQNLNQSHAVKERELNELRFEMNALRDGLNSSGKSTDDDKLSTLEMQLMEKNNLIVNLQGIIQNYEVEAQREIQELEQRENASKMVQLQNHIQMLEEKLTDLTQMEKSQSTELERQTAVMYSYEQRIRELEAVQHVQQPTQAALVAQFFDGPSTSQFPSEQQSQSMAALEIEDGWGWGGDGAVEVQQVAQVQSTMQSGLLSPRSDLEVRLQVQQDLVKELENEKVVLGEELNSLRENGKRMMKKLKEYQSKIKESETRPFVKASSVESNDLDLAIQDELNSQIVKLEAKLKEFNAEREKESHEKELLLKRVDVLTSASDRMTEMKERQDNQMEMYQMKIRELNQKLLSLEEWGDENVQEAKTVDTTPRKENQDELLKQIEALNVQMKDQQVDFDELNALLEEEKNNNMILEERIERLQKSGESIDNVKDEEIEKLMKLLKESSVAKESLSQQVAVKDEENRELMSKIYLLSNESDNIKTILDDLSVQHREKTNENQELNERLQKMVVSNEEMRQLFNSQSIEQNFQQHANELDQQIQQLSADVQYKDAQIMHLNGKIEELVRDDQTNSLVQGIEVKDEEIQRLKLQLLALANEKEELLKKQVNVPMNDDDNVRKRMEELERCNAELNQEKLQMEHELQVLNDQVLLSIAFEDKMKDAVMDLDAKDMEIQMLKNSIEQVQQQMSSQGTVTVDDKLIEEIERLKHDKMDLERNAQSTVDLLNAQWSQAVEQRGNEVANSWKTHLESKESEFAMLEAQLRGEMNEMNVSQATEATEKSDGEKSSAEDGEMTGKMKKIMESQELEIVSLKEQLAIRSAEYAQLASRADPYRQMPSIGANFGGQSLPANDSERVPRSELDLALYMLHQRDMRCEEMTHELINLLEERDTLQLRLSNAIRHFEEMRMKFNLPEPESTDVSKTTTPEKSTNVAGSTDGTETTSVDENLKTKLTEINNLRLSRDRGVLEEREQRFQQNMSMIQRDVMNLPQEAAARIVGQSSDQGQSPSSVLLNWILGKSDSSA